MLIFMLNRWFMGVMVPGKSDIPTQHSRKLLEIGKNSVITWWTWSKACSGTLDFPSKFFNTMQANSNWFQKQNDAEICVEIGVMAGLEEALGAQFALLLVCLQILSKMITFGFMLIWQHLCRKKNCWTAKTTWGRQTRESFLCNQTTCHEEFDPGELISALSMGSHSQSWELCRSVTGKIACFKINYSEIRVVK